MIYARLQTQRGQVSYTYLVPFIVSAVIAFWSGFGFNQMRNDANEKQAIETAAIEQRKLHALEQARSNAVLAAQVLARKSEARLRADAATSKSALIGLRDTSSRALQAAASSLAACTAISATYDELLIDSEGRYQELAVKADEHVIDLRVQIETP